VPPPFPACVRLWRVLGLTFTRTGYELTVIVCKLAVFESVLIFVSSRQSGMELDVRVWKTAVAGGITRVHHHTSLSHETRSNCAVDSTYLPITSPLLYYRLRLKCDGTRQETRFRLSAKRTIPFKSAGGVSSIDYWQPRCAHRR